MSRSGAKDVITEHEAIRVDAHGLLPPPVLDGMPQEKVREEAGGGEGEVGEWRGVVCTEPVLDGGALVRVSIRRDHWVLHHVLGDGAEEPRELHLLKATVL